MSEKSEKADMASLVAMPEFLRFLSRVIQTAEIHSATTNGAEGRHLVSEGRRDLGLNVLRDAARGIPAVDDPAAAFGLLLIQVLREEAQSTILDTPRARRARYDQDETDDDA